VPLASQSQCRVDLSSVECGRWKQFKLVQVREVNLKMYILYEAEVATHASFEHRDRALRTVVTNKAKHSRSDEA